MSNQENYILSYAEHPFVLKSKFVFNQVFSNPNIKAMEIRKSFPSEFVEIQNFYRKFGCQWDVNSRDFVLVAKKKDKIIGLVRINEEHGYPILEGLLVDKAFRKQGVATKLLNESELYSQDKEFYCIPNVSLKGFYKRFGFQAIEISKAPLFLKETLLFNNKRRKYTKSERVIIMMKSKELAK